MKTREDAEKAGLCVGARLTVKTKKRNEKSVRVKEEHIRNGTVIQITPYFFVVLFEKGYKESFRFDVLFKPEPIDNGEMVDVFSIKSRRR